ncbi:hypothetical protein HanPI659440_Chr10g0370011 [Helianthus annuus]|nr:hypothetical protein HanPI659440_Chr10g0370011 [Helianthus annuus]
MARDARRGKHYQLTLNKLGGSLERNGSNGSWMRRMFARTRVKCSQE